MACFGGHITVVGLLLSRSAELLHSGDKHGKTGLHIAAQHGRYQMCEVLLGQGAEINATDKVSSSHRSGSEPIGIVNLLWFCEKLWLLPAGDSPTLCVNWVEYVSV